MIVFKITLMVFLSKINGIRHTCVGEFTARERRY